MRQAIRQIFTDNKNLVKLFHINHGKLLHNLIVVFECHEVGRLAADIDKQRERRHIVKRLNATFRRGHSRVLLGARNAVEGGVLGALINQRETRDGFVTGHRSNARVHKHIVVFGNVVVPLGGHKHIALT
ncbi:hypothetical protein SDC9_189071 [bioreactor metagenome]|uniref:Uncharacterized protein n=1 Tax=bioreactor metagenome TaxID=1076179 RepID=A0A645HTI8_9ZZZZ